MTDNKPVSLFPLQIDLHCSHCEDDENSMILVCAILDAINQVRFIGECTVCHKLTEHVTSSPHSVIFAINQGVSPGLARPALENRADFIDYGGDGVGGSGNDAN